MTIDPVELERLAREYRLTMDKDVLHSWAGDAARALDDIADKLRTGQLVPAQPSGDEVEAVARVIQDEVLPGFGGISDLAKRQATAAITALDAVRGKQ